MTEIDAAAFEAGVASCQFSQDNLSAAGSSTPAHFSAALGRIYLTANAVLRSARPQAGHTQPALTVIVEDSADGSSWATVATFTFTASDQQSAAVDSPRAYLRASWAGVVGTWAVDVAVKSIATPASGGGSLPLHGFATHWFYGGGSLVADGDKWAFDWPNINVDWDTDSFVDAVNFEIRVPLDSPGLGGIYQARTRYTYSQAAAGGFVGTSVGETAMANTWAPCIFDDGTTQVIEGAKLFNEDDGGNDFDVTNLFNFSGHDVTLHRIDFWAVRLGPQPV